jgi:hypothetical protein
MFPVFHSHWYVLLILLVWGHVIADYPLQGDFLAKGKDPEGPFKDFFPWTQALFAHSMIQAGFVFLFTGSVQCFLMELIGHAWTDYAKTQKWISLNIDQSIHIGMKLFYLVVVFTSI